MCLARLFEIDLCCEIHTSWTLKVGRLYIYILGLQYMINSVFFVLRTCCQVPKSYGKSFTQLHMQCTTRWMRVECNHSHSQVFHFSISIISVNNCILGILAFNCVCINNFWHIHTRRVGLYKYKVKIVCIELSINMQDTPTTDSRGVLESISYASARKTSCCAIVLESQL